MKWATIAALGAAGHRTDDLDNSGNAPMLWLQAHGTECLDELLKLGADINTTDKMGCTILWWVVTSQMVSTRVGGWWVVI